MSHQESAWNSAPFVLQAAYPRARRPILHAQTAQKQ